MASSDEDQTYCLCKQPYDDSRFMIECDICNDWFHGSCVGIEEHQASDIDVYHCPSCSLSHGPLRLKIKRRKKRLSAELLDSDDTITVTSGVKKFVEGLKTRRFPNADKIIKEMRGYEVDRDYIENNGFTSPIIVKNRAGLDIRVPPPTFTVSDVEQYVGPMRELDVIDVAKQSDAKMLMREFVDYYNKPDKDRILNVISLEFSNTKLSEQVIPPRIVDEVSWVTKYWPEHTGDTRTFLKPEVQKYCLMSVKDSYTDFHVDFGGTSVWYHIIKGRKIFYLIEPTSTNLALYETWASSCDQNDIFFGDQVDECYKAVIEPGQTLFIPTGWIHGVYTPVDSLVFGGNFLHDYNIKMQLDIYEMENRIKTPTRFQFPNFETLCWFTAKNLMDSLQDSLDGGQRIPAPVLEGCEALNDRLASWMKAKDIKEARKHKDNLPQGISHAKLYKEFAKLISQVKNSRLTKRDSQTDLVIKETSNKGDQKERETLLGLKFKFNKIDNSLLKLKAPLTDPKKEEEVGKLEKVEEKSSDDEYDNSEEEKLKSCYSDDTYFYPPLVDSDDEPEYTPKSRKRKAVTDAWTPKNRVDPDKSTPRRTEREKVGKIKNSINTPSDNHNSGTKRHSSNITTSASKKAKIETPSSSMTTAASNKPKKGEKTAKQRLGKLLKIHKYNL